MRALGLALALALLACARPACPPPTTLRPDPRPFLWEVEGPAARVHLYGTFHAGGRAELHPSALARLSTARIYVNEIPPLDPDAVRAHATLPRGQSLPGLLGDQAWFELRDALAGVISDEALRRVRPWYAMSLLTRASADLPSPSMDELLAERARAGGARLEHLEQAGEQLAALGESITADDLRQALAERGQMRCLIAELGAAYRSGDGQAIRSELTGDAEARLLRDRNERWLDRIDGYLRGEGAFIAVGVSHLVGEGSLPALLEARGHRVTRVPR
jgi:uncharacterized protein